MKKVAPPAMPGQLPDPSAGPVPPTFMPLIEDLKVHYDIHAEAIKSLEFDALPSENKQLLIQHALETKMAMEMQAAGVQVGPDGKPLPTPGAPGADAGTGPPKPGGPGLSSHGKPTGATQHAGQGIQPIGASKGAPPKGGPAQGSTPVARIN